MMISTSGKPSARLHRQFLELFLLPMLLLPHRHPLEHLRANVFFSVKGHPAGCKPLRRAAGAAIEEPGVYDPNVTSVRCAGTWAQWHKFTREPVHPDEKCKKGEGDHSQGLKPGTSVTRSAIKRESLSPRTHTRIQRFLVGKVSRMPSTRLLTHSEVPHMVQSCVIEGFQQF